MLGEFKSKLRRAYQLHNDLKLLNLKRRLGYDTNKGHKIHTLVRSNTLRDGEAW
jgi:hypothetical protein